MAGPRVYKMCCLGVYVGEKYPITCAWSLTQHTPATHPIFTLLHLTGEQNAYEKYIILSATLLLVFVSFCIFLMQFTLSPFESDKIKVQLKQKVFQLLFFGLVEINQQEKRKLLKTQSVLGKKLCPI